MKAVANGSAYTAHEALENGLIDSIGYLDDAVVAKWVIDLISSELPDVSLA